MSFFSFLNTKMPSLLLKTAVTAASTLLSIAEAIMYKLMVASSSSVAFKGRSQQSDWLWNTNTTAWKSFGLDFAKMDARDFRF